MQLTKEFGSEQMHTDGRRPQGHDSEYKFDFHDWQRIDTCLNGP